jgi:PST family polysaccharide transporter
LAGTVVGKLGSFVVSLVLARLLAPEDFGIFAIALAATQFAMHVNDMGVIAATVQWRGRVEDMVPTGTTMALLFSAGWYLLFWFAAPAFATLAGSSDATPVVRLLTASILIDGVVAVRVGLIQRRFQQDKLTIAILAGFGVNAAVAITLASRGAGAYSFAIGQLCQAFVTGIFILWMARMPFRLGFDRAVAKRLIRFGAPLAAGLAAESALLYSDSIIVGHVLGPVLLGYYLLAFNVSSWIPGVLSTAVRYVSIPGFSRIAEHEEASFAGAARKAITAMFGVATPVVVGLAVLSPALLAVLYGTKWSDSSAPLRFLALVMVARLLTTLGFDIQTSLGKTHVTARVNATWVLALVPAIYVGANLGGITGAAAANAAVALLVAVPLILHSLMRSGVSLRPALPAILRILAGGAATALIMLATSLVLRGSNALQVVVGGALGGLAYLAIVVPARERAQVIAGLTSRFR